MEKEFAKVYQEKVVIPTYGIGEPDKNPMFLEKRVYQGSSGKVYPYPVIDKIIDEKKNVEYDAVFLENEYIRIMILPSLGGRIQTAYDKTKGYDFVYHNHVIKPALVGLLGPWISGGIEFNWPQHHRPTTYMPVSYEIRENEDGSASCLIGDIDDMYGTQVMTRFTVYPGKAYIEIKADLYNGTPLPQTFLWWANPAVAVNDDTQSVFPPDVNAVFDHGKRDVSRFPIATGVYYKHDYGEGVDISRYKNIPVPTSYMAYKSNYDFVGGYDYGKEAGILHIADHHISPGKKQWTWGCGDFGKAWDRNLTDADGPYIELMTGVYADNQPDFTFLMPYEEKSFTQYFMPYKKAGYVKNASLDLLLNTEDEDGGVKIVVYPTHRISDSTIVVTHGKEEVFRTNTNLSVEEGFTAHINTVYRADELTLSVYDAEGINILSEVGKPKNLEPVPSPAVAVKSPEDVPTTEELYLIGEHIEQYRHATFDPDPYYLEGLKRDEGDIRLNNAYGRLLLRRGCFAEAERYFRKAIERLTILTLNPYDSEPMQNLALALLYQGKKDDAYDWFYKSTWSEGQCKTGWYHLACISASKGKYAAAFDFVDRAISCNTKNMKAIALKAFILTHMGYGDEAKNLIIEAEKHNPFSQDIIAFMLSAGLVSESDARKIMGFHASSYLTAAADLSYWGEHKAAIQILALKDEQTAMTYYYTAREYSLLEDSKKESEYLRKGKEASPYCVFPSSLDDYLVLGYVIGRNPEDPKAPYYLGCLEYDKKRYQEAYENWKKSTSLDPEFPTAWRNLSIVLYNKMDEPEKALEALERAFSLDESDARVFLELDQLHEKLGWNAEKRQNLFAKYFDVVEKRDDLYITYVMLLNMNDQPEKALELIGKRHFHPWEGGEGKVTGQYEASLKLITIKLLCDGKNEEALKIVSKALHYPENLGEGKLEGDKDNDIHFLMGVAYERMGEKEKAAAEYKLGTLGSDVLSNPMYYNDQPADMSFYQGLCRVKLGDMKGARKKFFALVNYGETHVFDEIGYDYFAVSLPDLQLWNDNLTKRNQAHCWYLSALGKLALSRGKEAESDFDKALDIMPYLFGAIIHKRYAKALMALV